MQIEHILQSHGLNKGSAELVLPELTNFTATSKADGTGINLAWTNSAATGYETTVIFASEANITNATYQYCVENATKIVDSDSITNLTNTGHNRGVTVYYKGFMLFAVTGGTKINAGVGVSCVVSDITAPGTITSFSSTKTDSAVNLSWVNPTDIDFSKTKIVYKTGSYPASVSDGTVAYENSGTSVSITGLTNGTTYYFRAFTYDTTGNINATTTGQQLSDSPSAQKIYGVRVDTANSNPDTGVTYIRDSIGFTAMSGGNGTLSWGSWQTIFTNLGIKPCLLKSGVVQYYLNPANYAQKADGLTASDITTGAAGDVMIEFSKPIWYKWTDEGTTYTLEISDSAFTGAVKSAFEIESGYNVLPYYPLLLTQILFVILFKSINSQTALGRGRVDGTGYINTGGANAKGLFWGSTADLQIKFLGIEDYWGNMFQLIEGLVSDSSWNVLIGKSGFNNTGNGYTSFPTGLTASPDGYIASVQGGNDKGFLVKASGGSSSTYQCDYGYYATAMAAGIHGGHRSLGSNAGFTQFQVAMAATDGAANTGARLFYATTNKIYIGAYLGCIPATALRSLSGVTPDSYGTITAYRAAAKANV